MGFNGGNVSTTVSAHVHSNAAGQGGSLDGTSLINDNPMYSLILAMG